MFLPAKSLDFDIFFVDDELLECLSNLWLVFLGIQSFLAEAARNAKTSAESQRKILASREIVLPIDIGVVIGQIWSSIENCTDTFLNFAGAVLEKRCKFW